MTIQHVDSFALFTVMKVHHKQASFLQPDEGCQSCTKIMVQFIGKVNICAMNKGDIHDFVVDARIWNVKIEDGGCHRYGVML